MSNKDEILRFSSLPNARYPNNMVAEDKSIFDPYLEQVIPHMEVRVLNNILVSSYGTMYKNFSLLKECTPYYFDPHNDFLPQFMKEYIDAGGRFFGGSIERFVRHFLVFRKTYEEEAYFWCSDQYSHGYFHWLCETLPRIYLISLLGLENPKVILPGPTMRNVSFIQQSLDFLFPNITFSFTENQEMRRFKQLTWISQMGKPFQFNSPLIGSFREFVLGKLTGKFNHKKKRLYISRKTAIRRKILNEDQVERLLKNFGFEIICLEDYNFEEQIQMFSHSEIVIGIHGAGLANMIFLPKDCFVLELQRRLTWSTCYFRLANSLDLNYYYLFCNHDSEEEGGRLDNVNLKVDINALKKLLENVVNTCEAKEKYSDLNLYGGS